VSDCTSSVLCLCTSTSTCCCAPCRLTPKGRCRLARTLSVSWRQGPGTTCSRVRAQAGCCLNASGSPWRQAGAHHGGRARRGERVRPAGAGRAGHHRLLGPADVLARAAALRQGQGARIWLLQRICVLVRPGLPRERTLHAAHAQMSWYEGGSQTNNQSLGAWGHWAWLMRTWSLLCFVGLSACAFHVQ